MRKQIRLLAITCLLFTPVASMATIMDLADINGKGYFQDSATGYYWMDVDNFFQMTYAEVITELGGTTFHLASQSEINALLVSAGPSTTSTFANLYSIIGGFESPFGTAGYIRRDIMGIYESVKSPGYHFDNHTTGTYDPSMTLMQVDNWNAQAWWSDDTNAGLGAWAVSFTAPPNQGGGNGTNPGAVPEPATVLLFGTGIASLAGFRLRSKKN